MFKEHSKSDLYKHTVGDGLLSAGEHGVFDHHVAGRNSAQRSCSRSLYIYLLNLITLP